MTSEREPLSEAERYLESLSNLMKRSPLPVPSAVDIADQALAAEMGIKL